MRTSKELRRLTATLAMMIAAAVLSACGPQDRPIPEPTAGGAWGRMVVPYSDGISMIMHESAVEADPNNPAPIVTAELGSTTTFSARATSTKALQDAHLVVLPTGETQLLDGVWVTESDGSQRALSADERVALASERGVPVGDLSEDEALEFAFALTLPDEVECDSPTFRVWFLLRAGNGDRSFGSGAVQANTPECPTPAPSP